jgi:hypothetical protein
MHFNGKSSAHPNKPRMRRLRFHSTKQSLANVRLATAASEEMVVMVE